MLGGRQEVDFLKHTSMPKLTRKIIVTNLKTGIPCILIGGALGALSGSVNGIRVGIILGGVVAFILLRQNKRSTS